VLVTVENDALTINKWNKTFMEVNCSLHFCQIHACPMIMCRDRFCVTAATIVISISFLVDREVAIEDNMRG